MSWQTHRWLVLRHAWVNEGCREHRLCCLWWRYVSQRLRELEARMASFASTGSRLGQFSHRCKVLNGDQAAGYVYPAP